MATASHYTQWHLMRNRAEALPTNSCLALIWACLHDFLSLVVSGGLGALPSRDRLEMSLFSKPSFTARLKLYVCVCPWIWQYICSRHMFHKDASICVGLIFAATINNSLLTEHNPSMLKKTWTPNYTVAFVNWCSSQYWRLWTSEWVE